MQGGIPYNPKVFRNNEIPGEAFRDAPQKKTQAQSWSEEKWE
jgi:hypothetical protein